MSSKSLLPLWGVLFSVLCGCGESLSRPQEVGSMNVGYGPRSFDLRTVVRDGVMWQWRTFHHAGLKKIFTLDNDVEYGLALTERVYRDSPTNAQVVKRHLFGKRNMWWPRYDASNDRFLFIGDTDGTEDYNVYSLDPRTGSMVRLTSFAYAISYDVGASGDVYVAGKKALSDEEICVYRVPLVGEPQQLMCDSPEGRIYIHIPMKVNEDSRRIFLPLLKGSDRSTVALGEFDLDGGRVVRRLGGEGPREGMTIVSATRKEVVFQDSFGLNRVDLESGSTSVLFPEKLEGALKTPQGFIAVLNGGQGVALLDQNGQELRRDTGRKGYLQIWAAANSDSSRMVFPFSTSERDFFQVSLDGNPASPLFVEHFAHPGNAFRSVEHCVVTEVKVPTFDTETTGRALQAFVYAPVQPREHTRGIVMAHGGPSSHFDGNAMPDTSFLCMLGYTTIAANVRGSDNDGAEFSRLNDDDWGGGDYLDYVASRDFLAARLGQEPSSVGIMGGSYGGYMTNWAVTREGKAFAFGIGLFGMADLPSQMRESVIPDLITSEFSGVTEDAPILVERSPLQHAQNMDVPLLLVHGDRDRRVPTNQSRVFFERLKALGKDVSYLELPGEAHGFKYLDGLFQSYVAMAEFLYRVAPLP